MVDGNLEWLKRNGEKPNNWGKDLPNGDWISLYGEDYEFKEKINDKEEFYRRIGWRTVTQWGYKRFKQSKNRMQPNFFQFRTIKNEKGEIILKENGLSVNWSRYSTPGFALHCNEIPNDRHTLEDYGIAQINIKKLLEKCLQVLSSGNDISLVLSIKSDPTEDGVLMSVDENNSWDYCYKNNNKVVWINSKGEESSIDVERIKEKNKFLNKAHSLIIKAQENTEQNLKLFVFDDEILKWVDNYVIEKLDQLVRTRNRPKKHPPRKN